VTLNKTQGVKEMKKLLMGLLCMCFMSANVFGWATIVTTVKGEDKVVFTSNVDNVSVYLNGQKVGNVLNNRFEFPIVRDGQPKVFEFQKAGYGAAQFVMTKSVDPIFWLNIIGGNVIGSSIDSLFTKNVYAYSPGQYYIDLKQY
tara:strand:- start:30 stop:461 length:432 start_codon:yes stop_codon:yes gene_type:complete